MEDAFIHTFHDKNESHDQSALNKCYLLIHDSFFNKTQRGQHALLPHCDINMVQITIDDLIWAWLNMVLWR